MKHIFILIASALASLSFAQNPTNVVATVGMVGDIAQNVGGECAEVDSTAQAQDCPACGERAAYGSHWIFAGGLLA